MIYQIRRNNPINTALAMRRAMDELFNDMDFQWGPRGVLDSAAQVLPLDVYETEDSLIVEAALPGFDPKAVEITFNQGTLSLPKAEETKPKRIAVKAK